MQRYYLELVPGQVIEPNPLLTLRPSRELFVYDQDEVVSMLAYFQLLYRFVVRHQEGRVLWKK